MKESTGRKVDAAIALAMAFDVAATKKKRGIGAYSLANPGPLAREQAAQGIRCPRCFARFDDGGARTHFCPMQGWRLQ